MSTINLVLTIILAAALGFMIGNAYGQAKMKLIITGMLSKMTDGLKNAVVANKKEDNGTNE